MGMAPGFKWVDETVMRTEKNTNIKLDFIIIFLFKPISFIPLMN